MKVPFNSCTGCLLVVLSSIALQTGTIELACCQDIQNRKNSWDKMMDSWYRKDINELKHSVEQLEKIASKTSGENSFLDHYYAGLGRRQLASYSENKAADLEQAIVHLENALKANDDSADTHALLGNIYRMLIASGNHKGEWFVKAKEHREKAWELDQENPRVLLLEASALIYIPSDRGGDVDSGIAFAFEAAARFSIQGNKSKISWGEADSWALIGSTLRRKGKQEQSAAAFKRALEVQPNWSIIKSTNGNQKDPGQQKQSTVFFKSSRWSRIF